MDSFDQAYKAWKMNNNRYESQATIGSYNKGNMNNLKVPDSMIDELICVLQNTGLELKEACEHIGLDVHMNTIRYRLRQRGYNWKDR